MCRVAGAGDWTTSEAAQLQLPIDYRSHRPRLAAAQQPRRMAAPPAGCCQPWKLSICSSAGRPGQYRPTAACRTPGGQSLAKRHPNRWPPSLGCGLCLPQLPKFATRLRKLCWARCERCWGAAGGSYPTSEHLMDDFALMKLECAGRRSLTACTRVCGPSDTRQKEPAARLVADNERGDPTTSGRQICIAVWRSWSTSRRHIESVQEGQERQNPFGLPAQQRSEISSR